MKHLFKHLIYLCTFIFYPFLLYATHKSFVVIIPSYNNIQWCEQNLRSVFGQEYDNYRVIYVNDCSDDGTKERVEQLVDQLGQKHRFMMINNTTRRGAMANWFMAVWLCEPHEVVVSLDGDDWFAHERVLTYLDSVYQDPEVWMTYGQFIIHNNNQIGWCRQVSSETIEKNQFRDDAWVTSHLRTFYAGLFHGIPKEDFMVNGQFYQSAADLAIMYPLLERAGKHSRFIPEILYVYNRINPINDERVNYNLQTNLGIYIRAQKRHQPIERFDDATEQRTIYIQKGLWGCLFDINSHHNRDNCLYPTYLLRIEMAKKGYRLVETDTIVGHHNAHAIVCFDVPMAELERLPEYPTEKLYLFLWEPPSVSPHNYNQAFHYPFAKVATWMDELVDGKKYHKMYYPVRNEVIKDVVPFEQKKLATMIAFNKNSGHPRQLYGQRAELVNFFEHYHQEDFDIYGNWWPQHYKTYKGTVKSKVDTLKHYKFVFAYENIEGISGYVTEKMFDVFWAGAVPVYWGADNIEQYVPKNCFIDRRDFADNEQLYQHLKNMSKETYEQYLVNIKNYLASSQSTMFSPLNLSNVFSQMVLNEPLSA
ncbi:MAG: glycosyltransferase family 10 domain-containing protein [Candidatus Dependentiae bacterium]